MNKTTLSLALALAFAAEANAQLNGNGYYRVENVYTGRYIIMTDNKARSVDVTTDPDLGALETLKPFSEIVSNPASVFYIENISGSSYNITAQGANAYDFTGYYLNIKANSDGASYKAYGQNSFTLIYLSDLLYSDDDNHGQVLTNSKTTRDWYILPISSSSSTNYFGFTPEVSVGGKHYTTVYASFSMQAVSSGLRFLYVSRIDAGRGIAVYKELSGAAPALTPLIVECASTSASDNRANVGITNTATPEANQLGGVLFCRDNTTGFHRNTTAYDASTMRLFGTCSDGSLGFVTSTATYLPANKAYLKVPTGSPTEFRLMTEEEYATGITEAEALQAPTDKAVYNLSGNKVADSIEEALPKGIYLFKGGKIIISE